MTEEPEKKHARIFHQFDEIAKENLAGEIKDNSNTTSPEALYDFIGRRLLSSFEKKIDEATRHEGELTRLFIRDTVVQSRDDVIRVIQEGRLTILDCFKFNPVQNAKVISLLGLLLSAFSVVVSVLVGVHLLHPLLAVLGVVGGSGFFAMAKFEELRKV